MSKLYEQAIADSKKLKEVLRQEVETDVLKKYKPYIEKMVEQEIEGFLFEQDEPEGLDLNAPTDPTSTDSTQAIEQPQQTAQVEKPTAEPVDTSFSAPITPVGGNATMPIPDADGKVIVSFESLFSSPTGLPQPTETPVAAPESVPAPAPETVSPETPAAAPEPSAEAPQPEQSEQPQENETSPEAPAPAEKFNPEKLQEARDKIGTLENEYANMFMSKKIGLKEVSEFSYKLLETYSDLENMKDLKEIRESAFDVLSLKMENLYKLIQNSEKLYDSYHRTQKITEGNHIMKVHPKTRSFLNGLLESLETGFGDDGTVEKVSEPLDALDKVADKAGKAAAAASKPKLVDPERGKQAPFKHKAKEDESLLKEDATEEVDSDESESSLDEEIAALEKEMDEMLGSGESSVMESKKVSKKEDKKAKKAEVFKKVKKLKEQLAAAQKEMDECGGMEGSSGQTTITITTDGKVDGADSDVGSKVDLVDADGDEDDMTLSSDGEDLNEEDMFEIVMDEDESMDEEWDMDETKSPEEMPSSLQESKQMKSLKEYAKELETVAARSLYINKVFANYDGLSKKQKELVVEYIDRAKNPEDAKRIYGRIKKQLSEAKAEAATKTEKKAGSLNESVSRKPVNTGNAADKIVIGSADRFRELVNNKKNG